MNQKISNAGFAHIALRVSDMERSLKFYTEGLGMTVLLRWGEGDGSAAMLDIGNGDCIEVFAGGKNREKDENENGSFFHLAIATDDPDGAYANAIAAGATPKIEPKDACIPDKNTPWPLRIAFVNGPDGEILEFFKRA